MLTLFRSRVTGEKREGRRKTRKRKGRGSHILSLPHLPPLISHSFGSNSRVAGEKREGGGGGVGAKKSVRGKRERPFLPHLPALIPPPPLPTPAAQAYSFVMGSCLSQVSQLTTFESEMLFILSIPFIQSECMAKLFRNPTVSSFEYCILLSSLFLNVT